LSLRRQEGRWGLLKVLDPTSTVRKLIDGVEPFCLVLRKPFKRAKFLRT
jgi:hypothetical protein